MTLALFAHGKTARIVRGDALDILRCLPNESADSVVTDPPSGIGFMGKEWDSNKGGRDQWVAWLATIMFECRRILKPGGHSLTWALPRTSHWTGFAIENAGFEIRDRVTHLFGEGMPKSPYVLKPAAEDWWLARKPIERTVKETIAKYGTGGLNIEGCRLDGVPDSPGSTPPTINGNRQTHGAMTRTPYIVPSGRWPANATLDEAAAQILDEQTGERRSGGYPGEGAPRTGRVYNAPGPRGKELFGPSGGGASRFFYVAKADELEKSEGGTVDNDHETVKSVSLMRWLVRLITPPGGLVIDPFAGSGTTGVACANEGMSFIGIEQSSKHHATAKRRLERWFGSVALEVS